VQRGLFAIAVLLVVIMLVISRTGQSFFFVSGLDRDVLPCLSQCCLLHKQYTVTHYKFYSNAIMRLPFDIVVIYCVVNGINRRDLDLDLTVSPV